jgi:hypothetical protein
VCVCGHVVFTELITNRPNVVRFDAVIKGSDEDLRVSGM